MRQILICYIRQNSFILWARSKREKENNIGNRTVLFKEIFT